MNGGQLSRIVVAAAVLAFPSIYVCSPVCGLRLQAEQIPSTRGFRLQAEQIRLKPDPTGGLVQSDGITFTKDVAPILFGRCSACHHPGGSAPFSVLTYESVKQRATQIAAVTKSRYMPPWKAEPESGEFIGQTRLTDGEIELIGRWVAEGAVEGDERDLPPQPPTGGGWQLGTPDLIVSLSEAYTLQAAGTDVFRIFVIPLPVEGPRFVRGMEFKPGNAKVVHHANIRIDRTPASRRFDEQGPGAGYDGLIAHSATYPDGHFLGWTPGQVPPLLPKGLAWQLDRGTDLVVELHMQPSGKPELVQPTIGFYFGSDPPERTPAMLRLGRQSIDIPPGEQRYTITDSFVLPVDVEVQAVQPHAHYRAREMEGVATLPGGATRRLIHIKDWDFRWQHVYRYVNPFTLPKGTTLAMRYTYDNSAENPRNPHLPPRRVFWGQRSADEMGDFWIQVLTRNDRDLATLMGHFGPKVMAEDVFGYEREIQVRPADAALRDSAAVLYLRLGRTAEAIGHFEVSAKLNPESAAAHYNLGTALTVAGRLDGAVARYRRALQINPKYALAHNNLGSILLLRGNVTEALGQIGRAVELDPANPESHYNLARARRARGDLREAAGELRRVLQLKPDWPSAMGDLAWLLATAPDETLRDPAEAVRLAERAADLTGPADAAALDVLAAAYAAAGRFDRAVETALAALAAAPDGPLRAAIGERLALYKLHQPYQAPTR